MIKLKKRLLSIVLALTMISSLFVSVSAAENDTKKSVTVSFTAQAYNAFLCAPQTNKIISADLAESFGYSDSVTDGVSALDVLVCAHQCVFDDFSDKKSDYLTIEDGSITKIFGIDTIYCGFAINGKTAHDDNLIESEYGKYYTGYTIDTAAVNNNDFVEFFIYQDSYSMDNYAYFEENSKRVSSLTCEQNTATELVLKGYSIGWYGCNTEDDILANTAPIANAQLCLIDPDTGAATDIKDAVTDKDGKVSITLSDVGNCLLSAYMPYEAEQTPIFMPLVSVKTNAETPKFDTFEFLATAFSDWKKGETFSKEKLYYNLHIKYASTKTVTVQSTTSFNSEKYKAFATYTDADNKETLVEITPKKITYLKNIPFGDFELKVTICEKANEENKTVYTFLINRPFDEGKYIKEKSGISIAPADRDISNIKYNGQSECTLFQCDEDGSLPENATATVTKTYNNYHTYLFESADKFRATITASTDYAHIRYSADGGSWKEFSKNSGTTDDIQIDKSGTCVLKIQILDDKTYQANLKNYNDGFFETEPNEYTVWVTSIEVNYNGAKILTAAADNCTFYPSFNENNYSYGIVTNTNLTAPVSFPNLTFSVSEGATVTLNDTPLEADENSNYSIELKTDAQNVTVTSKDNSVTNTYSFSALNRSKYDVPDKVVDYFCIGSQYTNQYTGNNAYGTNPEKSLAGKLRSLGNFGGYITYYYENPITDNPNNKYGIDFYVYGNSFAYGSTASEPGQVYVSEDNKTWYALAGSEHYSDTAYTDYTITYTKDRDGNASWSDNKGNVSSTLTSWPSSKYYYFNDYASKDTYTYSGIVLKSTQGTITGDSTTNSNAAEIKFGYADAYPNGSIGVDVNPYIEKPSCSNGFDLKWAVDENSNPIDVSDKEFHYIKVATASNIWAGSYKEKSTEVSNVVRTTPQENAVGKTSAISGITVSDSVSEKVFNFTDGKTVYDFNTDEIKYASISVNGASEDDNVYINNTRISYGKKADGFKITNSGKTLVRIIVQNGDKEPQIYLLRLTSNQEETQKIIESVKTNVGGNVKTLTSKDDKNYNLNVGHKISSFAFFPVAEDSVTYTVNSQAPQDSYDLDYGENIFEIIATDKDGNEETAVLTVVRNTAPSSGANTKNITVYFTLYGDEEHSEDIVHTYKSNKSKLQLWIAPKAYTLPYGSTVLDLFEQALKDANLTFTNAGGNYISEINGLSEFSNGSNSGWMYLINNKHSEYGINEQELESGDRIIFHYTDDYTSEEGSEVWSGGWNSSSSNKTDSTNKDDKNPSSDDKDNSQKDDTNQPSSDKDEIKNPFKDINENDWFFDDILAAYKSQIVSGVSEDEFEPDCYVTRAMLTCMLYRIENEPEAPKESPFVDIKDDAYYKDAVLWANENKIACGISANEFAPDLAVTREQAATILYRYANFKKYSLTSAEELTNFKDFDKISSWAVDAVKWAYKNEIMLGNENSEFMPQSSTTRAQITSILMRMINKNK